MTSLHDEIPFADSDDSLNDDLELTPLLDDERELAPDEPFRPDMILVPVLCGTCKLRIYAQEKFIGKWIRCPDCGVLSEIRPVDPLHRFTVEMKRGGGYSLVPLASEFKPNPIPRVNIDYRTLDGSLDKDAEAIPYYGFDDSSDDNIENALDHLLGKNKTLKRREEIKFERLTEEARQKKIPVKETSAERQKRFLEELNTQKAQRGKEPLSTPVSISTESVRKASETAPADFESMIADKSTGPKILVAGSKRKEGCPWNHFFDPFWDAHNYRRFTILWGCGLVAIAAYFILSQFLKACVNPSGDSKMPFATFFSLFYIQYLITLFPMILWIVLLLVNGMTLYSETKEGKNRIRHWIPFRVEFASGYLFWLIWVAWIGTLPGSVLGLIFRLFHVVWNPGGVPITHSVVLAGVSCFFLLPLFFLSIDANCRGVDLYHKRVWESVVRRFSTWGTYYFFSLVLVLAQLGGLIGVAFFYLYSVEWSLGILIPAYFVVGAVFCALTSLIIHLKFRLLGCLAWSILEE